MIFENRFIYFPARYPEGFYERANNPDQTIQPYPLIDDVWLTTEDGVKIHGWYCTPARDGMPLPTQNAILYLHGNAGNLSCRYDQLHLMMFLGCTILIIDYRGYGRSEGKPSETGLYLDALAGLKHLTGERGFQMSDVFLLGKSLGGAIAIELASQPQIQPAGVILQAAFTSIADMARIVMPIVPKRWIRTKMDNLAKINRVTCPKLFIHGTRDRIVPYDMGRRLYDAAAHPKDFVRVDGADHNDVTQVAGRDYITALNRLVVAAEASSAPAHRQ